MALTRTTKLEAVNTMLTSIGEAPVNSLSSSNLTQDAAIALNILDEINRDVQAEGWYFNTETNVEFTRNSSDYIEISDNIMDIDPDESEHPTLNVSMRGGYLYDLSKTSGDRYAFDEDITATVVYLLDFTNLPQAARRYITLRAARTLADRMVGSADLSRILREDELRAYENLNMLETSSSDSNYLSDSDSLDANNRYI